MSARLDAIWRIDKQYQHAKKTHGPDSPQARQLREQRTDAYEQLTITEQGRYMFLGL